MGGQLALFILYPGLYFIDILRLPSVVCLESCNIGNQILLDGSKLLIGQFCEAHELGELRNAVLIHKSLNIEHNIRIELLGELRRVLSEQFLPAKYCPAAIFEAYKWKFLPFKRFIAAKRGAGQKSLYGMGKKIGSDHGKPCLELIKALLGQFTGKSILKSVPEDQRIPIEALRTELCNRCEGIYGHLAGFFFKKVQSST